MHCCGGVGSSRYVLVASGVDVKWWSSSTVVENFLPFGLSMRALGGVGYMVIVYFVAW